MAQDAQAAAEAIPTVRVFRWNPPAISLGWKQSVPEWLKISRWREAGLELVERPTGGGIAFHGSDVSIAVIVPRAPGLSLQTFMRAVCQTVTTLCHTYGIEATSVLHVRGDGRLTYCLMEPSPYAVLIDGKKTAGFAIRRYSESWLIQGSLLVRQLAVELLRILPSDIAAQLEARALPLAQMVQQPLNEREVAERLAAHWSAWWDGALVHELEAVR